MSELETVWSGQKGLYIGSCLREMPAHTTCEPPEVITVVHPSNAERMACKRTIANRILLWLQSHPDSSANAIVVGVFGHRNGTKYQSVTRTLTVMKRRRQIQAHYGVGKAWGRPSFLYRVMPCPA